MPVCSATISTRMKIVAQIVKKRISPSVSSEVLKNKGMATAIHMEA